QAVGGGPPARRPDRAAAGPGRRPGPAGRGRPPVRGPGRPVPAGRRLRRGVPPDGRVRGAVRGRAALGAVRPGRGVPRRGGQPLGPARPPAPVTSLPIRPPRAGQAEVLVTLIRAGCRGDTSRAGGTRETELAEGDRTRTAQVRAMIERSGSLVLAAETEAGIVACCQ